MLHIGRFVIEKGTFGELRQHSVATVEGSIYRKGEPSNNRSAVYLTIEREQREGSKRSPECADPSSCGWNMSESHS